MITDPGARWLLLGLAAGHDVASRNLVPGYDRPTHDLRYWNPKIVLDDLLELFSEHDVEVSQGENVRRMPS
ncbi:hypothetical protein AB0C27_06630 [Nonomuraea sp. NPDC048882]|uniref:hypothetical protein n=1 Tax=Nonomuraea sp. NPDC048882 TaxID=3154347 RepID=UPI0033D10085